ATLNGASEVSPTTSPGSATAVMNVLNKVLTYNISFSNLLSAATASHIHGPADTSHNAGVIIPFPNTPATSSGTYSGTAAVSNQQLAEMVQGLTYANIHTTNYPGGEIRGQVLLHN